MNEEVSVVIPVRNRESLIVRCLDSVFAQTCRPLRVIVVDNNSTDSTAQVVREWSMNHTSPGFRTDLYLEDKPGASAARNRGLREVGSPYTLFFDSDDEMHPGLVEKALKAIGDGDLVYWQGEVTGLDGRRFLKPFYTDDLLRRQFYNSILSTQVYMAKTSLFREVGGWEERAMVWNDWELGIRIALREPKTVALSEVLTLIHSQEDSITGRSFSDRTGDWEATMEIVEEKIAEEGIEAVKRDRADRMLCYRRVNLAAQYVREGQKESARKLLDRAFQGLGRGDRLKLRLLYFYMLRGGRGSYYLWQK